MERVVVGRKLRTKSRTCANNTKRKRRERFLYVEDEVSTSLFVYHLVVGFVVRRTHLIYLSLCIMHACVTLPPHPLFSFLYGLL